MSLIFVTPVEWPWILFALLTFNAMRDDGADIALCVLVVTVLGSVVLHGMFGTKVARALVAKV